MAQNSTSHLLALPTEIRLQIWTYLLSPPQQLIMRSLFIRAYYRTVFMSQQSKGLECQLLRVCKDVAGEILPILYGIPHWRAQCRFENLAGQISIANFCLIKRMSVDVDDLPGIADSLLLDLKEEDVPISPWPPVRRRLRFVNLEVLQVDGYQCIALTSKGNSASRLEGLRLCKLAGNIISYHPSLSVLAQTNQAGTGGSDAIDVYMERVKWKFLRDVKQITPDEHVVDLSDLETLLQALMDNEGNLSHRANWSEKGQYQQYPYLQQS